ncbi:MAG: NCS2 family permease [Opitutaceae bacterium]|jgi:AGZA family xanthine/uracil permease-like MFS transporter|nr:NCS2 family permease [Opitutaceae bacterium]MBP9913649.1 NCS2 family permease [Opitutaceae bacterium]
MLNRLFKLAQHGTTPGREVQAGCTTFAAMAYILAVNPAILAAAGMPAGGLVTVTAVSAAVSTLIMALYTNLPLALAPGMGINAYFSYTVCIGLGVPWQQALGLVFINGLAFLALSLSGIREKIINVIPYQLKMAITCGIGLFIAFIGLKNGGIIAAHPETLVTHGQLGSPPVLLCFAGILLTVVLLVRRVPGGIILSIVAITLVGLVLPDGHGRMVTSLPDRLVSLPASMSDTFLQFNLGYFTQDPMKAITVVLTLLLIALFDNVGTLIGVTQRAGLLDKEGRLPGAGKALVADSLGVIASASFGTSNVVSYIESASGVEAGGRTGLVGVTVAALFIVALFFTPLIQAIPAVATAPALVVVGIFMFQSVTQLNLDDLAETAPAFIIILATPLTFSIAEGIGLGLVAYALIHLAVGRGRQVAWMVYALAGIFAVHLFRGLFTG